MTSPDSNIRGGFAQLWVSALDWPSPAGTWMSVVRRAAVVASFLVIGMTTGNLVAGIGAAFGALQMGLTEAALPLRRLILLLSLNVTAMAATAFAAAALGGTWWTVPLLAGVALMQGSTLSAGTVPGTTFIGALTIGVLFAAVPHDLAEAGMAAVWVAVGALAQATFWLFMWKRDRRMYVRRALANGLRATRRILDQRPGEARFATMASAEPERILSILDTSGAAFELLANAQAVSSASSEVRRSIIAWMVLRNPSAAEKKRLATHLDRLISSIDDFPGSSADRIPAYSFPSDSSPTEWICEQTLARDLAELKKAILVHRSAETTTSTDTRPPPTHEFAATLKSLSPSNPHFGYGVRMASAIAVAQAGTLLVDVRHSFWAPLAIVFVLKPDWSFTAVRTVGRIGGNLLAVLVVPVALMLTGGQVWAVALLTFALAVIMYRYFTGNYIAACLGVTGSILVLNQVLASDESLYATRIIANVIGAVVALAFALIFPTWRSRDSPQCLAGAVSAFAAWTAVTMRALVNPVSVASSEIRAAGADARRTLFPLRSTAEAAVLEPVGRVDRAALMGALVATERIDLNLLALAAHARYLNRSGLPGLVDTAQGNWVLQQLDGAARAAGLEPTMRLTSHNVADATAPASAEQRALIDQVDQLGRHATALSHFAERFLTNARTAPRRGSTDVAH